MSGKKRVIKAEGGRAGVLTNCTDAARGVMLPGGVLVLGPREMRVLSDKESEGVRALFGSRTFQRLADGGIFRLSGLGDDEESVATPTASPPADLSGAAVVDGLAAPVGTATGGKAAPPAIVGTYDV